MLAWMDDEALHRTLTTGRATYWSRSRQEYWVKGETSGNRQWVRERAAGLRRRRAAGAGRPGGRRPATPASAPASTARCRRSPGERRVRFGVTIPTREEFDALDRPPMVPVTRRLLADSETAVGVYRKLAGNRPGTVLLESAEQGKRWARYSFVGVRSAGVLTERDGATRVARRADPGPDRRPARRPAGRRPDAGPPAALAAHARTCRR